MDSQGRYGSCSWGPKVGSNHLRKREVVGETIYKIKVRRSGQSSSRLLMYPAQGTAWGGRSEPQRGGDSQRVANERETAKSLVSRSYVG